MNLISSLTSTATTSPVLIEGWAARNASRNVKHNLIGGGQAVSLVKNDPDSGTARLLYSTAAAAFAARDMLGETSLFELSSDEIEEINMTFAADDIDVELQEDRTHWVVSLSWQKVTL